MKKLIQIQQAMKTLLIKLTQIFQAARTNFKIYSLILVCVLMGLMLLVKSCENRQLQKHLENVRVPDTFFVKKPYKVTEIKTQYIEKPIKVYVYLKDTTLRKEVEQSDIITGVHLKRKNLFSSDELLTLDKITPKGIVLRNEYITPKIGELRIDEKGNVEIKKKKFTKFKRAAAIILPLAAGFIIGREVYKK